MPKTNSDYMERVPPILVKPLVAAVIGLNEAIILQQVIYWLNKSGHRREGRRWIYNTYAEWREQFPFWSTSTIGRIFRKLEDNGLIISRQFNAENYDQTKWYTVDYDLLDSTLEQSEFFDDAKLTPSDDAKLERSTITETTQETSSSKGNGHRFIEVTDYKPRDSVLLMEKYLGKTPGSEVQLRRLVVLEEMWELDGLELIFNECVRCGVLELSYAEGISKRLKQDSEMPSSLGAGNKDGQSWGDFEIGGPDDPYTNIPRYGGEPND